MSLDSLVHSRCQPKFGQSEHRRILRYTFIISSQLSPWLSTASRSIQLTPWFVPRSTPNSAWHGEWTPSKVSIIDIWKARICGENGFFATSSPLVFFRVTYQAHLMRSILKLHAAGHTQDGSSGIVYLSPSSCVNQASTVPSCLPCLTFLSFGETVSNQRLSIMSKGHLLSLTLVWRCLIAMSWQEFDNEAQGEGQIQTCSCRFIHIFSQHQYFSNLVFL